jgi:hypothetical protein
MATIADNHHLIISKVESLTSGGSFGLIPGRMKYWADKATEAEEHIEFAVVTRRDAQKATAMVKILTEMTKELDDERKRYTRPIDELKEQIVAAFAGSLESLKAVKAAINSRLSVWLVAEKARERAEAEAKAEADRKAAEALASAARSEGDETGAAEIESLAGKVEAQKTVVRSELGGMASVREIVSGSVAGGKTKREFLAWAAEYLSVDDLEQITIGQRLLNRIAKASHESGKPVPGLTVTATEGARVA